jgi:CRISPR-associated protein Csm5
MSADAVLELAAIPLTPIHVGDGTVLGPEDYKLDEQKSELVRFAPVAVLADMPEAARRNYLLALDRGDLQAGWRILREWVRDTHVLDRIAVGQAAYSEIKGLFSGQQRKGEIRPMLRSGGRPLVPGTSLKGAIRTAVLSALAPNHRREIEKALDQHRPRRTGPASDAMQKAVLGYENTDQDPFRFVQVADISFPSNATRIDRVVNWRPARPGPNGRQPAEKMQMIFERLRAAVDQDGAPIGETVLTVAAAKRTRAAQLARAKAPSLALDAAELCRCVNAFHWRLLEDEEQRFYADEPKTRAALNAAFRVRLPDGTVLDRRALRDRHDVMLLRIGRFGQFESKSIHCFRAGWNAQAKPPHKMTEGNTRNLAKLADDRPLVPFGWLLLAPPGTRPEPRASRGVTTAARGATPAPARAPRYFLGDEQVQVLSRDGDKWMVLLPNGDKEPVDPSELKEER